MQMLRDYNSSKVAFDERRQRTPKCHSIFCQESSLSETSTNGAPTCGFVIQIRRDSKKVDDCRLRIVGGSMLSARNIILYCNTVFTIQIQISFKLGVLYFEFNKSARIHSNEFH